MAALFWDKWGKNFTTRKEPKLDINTWVCMNKPFVTHHRFVLFVVNLLKTCWFTYCPAKRTRGIKSFGLQGPSQALRLEEQRAGIRTT